METVNNVGSCDRNCNKTPAPRVRKISVDHSHLRPVYLDVNSNRLSCRRLSSWGEGSSLGAAILKLDGSNCDKTRATENGVADWQNYFMTEIEKLAAAGKLDSASRNTSNAMNTCDLNTNRLNKHTKQRRQSTAHCMTEGFTRGSHGNRSYSVNNGARSRRKSCFTMSSDMSKIQNMNQHLPAWQGLRRVKNINDTEHGLNVRRKSTVKQPTFTVPRLTNVQRKSYQIYKRRRRNRHKQEMARLNNGEENVNADVDINENPSRDEVHEQEVEEVAEDVEQELCDLVHDHLVTHDSEKPVPRRKNSIQTRSWEISRQRRKGRRRVEKETDG